MARDKTRSQHAGNEIAPTPNVSADANDTILAQGVDAKQPCELSQFNQDEFQQNRAIKHSLVEER